MVREWRGTTRISSCSPPTTSGRAYCNVIQSATGRIPTALAHATRQWNGGVGRGDGTLGARGWLDADGTVTAAGTAAREQIEVETDEHCAALWAPIGATVPVRLASMASHRATDAFTAAWTLRPTALITADAPYSLGGRIAGAAPRAGGKRVRLSVRRRMPPAMPAGRSS